MPTGTIKVFFTRDRPDRRGKSGYGFISQDDGPDIFVNHHHIGGVRAIVAEDDLKGTQVTFTVGHGRNGAVAHNVRPRNLPRDANGTIEVPPHRASEIALALGEEEIVKGIKAAFAHRGWELMMENDDYLIFRKGDHWVAAKPYPVGSTAWTAKSGEIWRTDERVLENGAAYWFFHPAEYPAPWRVVDDGKPYPPVILGGKERLDVRNIDLWVERALEVLFKGGNDV